MLQIADKVISSKTVFTGDNKAPMEASIAVLDNKILKVGPFIEMQQYIGEETELFDFGDKLVMPGFHDNHIHIMMGSLSLQSVDLFDAQSEEEVVQKVYAFSEENPNNPWIIGYTWDAGYWDNPEMPTRHALDQKLPDRPVVLFHAEGHYAWVNSKALEICGIHDGTKDPEFGKIERSSSGEMTGILYEKAMTLITREAYSMTKEKKRELLYGFLQHAASLGVTSVNDVYGSDFMETLDDYELLKELDDEDKLTTRIHLFTALNNPIDKSIKYRERYQSNKMRVSGLKQFVDGVITSRTAMLLDPYADDKDEYGDQSYSKEQFQKWITAADREGFGVKLHCIGDGAVRLALDVYEQAMITNGTKDVRHSIEHVEILNSNDQKRFKELGVIASMQPNHFAMSERNVYSTRIGVERDPEVFAIKTLEDEGTTIAFGTDFPIDDLNPFSQIHRAVTRLDNTNQNTWNPKEAISLVNALTYYTKSPAYAVKRENELGTLEEDKFADIVVLDRNVFECGAEELLNTKVAMTMMDGKVVYQQA